MSNHLKIWWEKRKAKHYVKSHWHLIIDIVLLLIILGFIINLAVITGRTNKKVDTTSVTHVSKIIATTTQDALLIKTEISKTNIYSGVSFDLHLRLENKSGNELTNINLTPAFAVKGFIISNVSNHDLTSRIKTSNNQIALDRLDAGEVIEGDISVIINTKKDSPRLVSWLFKTTYTENQKGYSVNYNLDNLKVITDLKVKAAAYYNSQLGDQLGSGPIPPMLGLPTNYWVFFTVDNQGNDLSNLTISAKLPESVTLSNNKTLTAGDFTYNESQKRITWTVKKISVNNGRYQAGFEVQLLPTDKQVGLKPLLLTNISYLATDAYTEEKIGGKLPYIDTDLPLDIINQGQGKVVE